MRIVERPGVLSAFEWDLSFLIGLFLLGASAVSTFTHVLIAPSITWEQPWRIVLITGLGVFAVLVSERRTFIVDSNERMFTLIRKRVFHVHAETITFERAERFEFVPYRFGLATQNSLHLIHDRGMLHVFGQDRQAVRLRLRDAERIARAAGLELRTRTL